MALTSADLKWYGSTNMPINDTDAAGGLINLSTRVVFDNTTLTNTLNDYLRMYSTLAEDTGTFKVYGRDASRILNSETFTLDGANHISGVVLFSEILMCSGNHHGTLTIQSQTAPATIIAMESGVDIMRKPFYDLRFTSAGKTAYEKVFLKNTHATDALQDAYLIENSDPSGKFTFAVSSGQNTSDLATNRITLPTDIAAGSFISTSILIPGTHLYPGSGLGVWLKTDLTGTEHSFKTTYTLSTSGTIIV